MIQISQLKLPVTHTAEELKKKTARMLRIAPEQIQEIKIKKRSIDARKKDQLLFIYTVEAVVNQEKKVLHKAKSPDIQMARPQQYRFPAPGSERLRGRPVIIGFGPAGLFAGLMLARSGYQPLILERGEEIAVRNQKVEQFWKGGLLDPESNVQFGEGGAGTFSDGKLNTLIKDPHYRSRLVLETFVEAGADAAILYLNKPHIGTDVLQSVVTNIRQEIIRLGGEVRFGAKVTGFLTEGSRLVGVKINDCKTIETGAVVLAVGHSARDTFRMLLDYPLVVQAKSFAVGLRIQHPQSLINRAQYGLDASSILGAADYKLTQQTANGRGVYSFCMCPGGFVVDASSEPGRLAVNGMSYHARDGENANSALIVTVSPADFPDAGPLGGVLFQEQLEERAWRLGKGRIPVQLYGDFCKGQGSTGYGVVGPAFRGRTAFADLRQLMPEALNQSLIEAMAAFGRKIPGFDRADSILSGIESRTSSPVRISRNEAFESSLSGLFPCGEGAGYAGGIMSAAMDGIKVAEEIAAHYQKLS